jgi:pyroglutamyl-peptidase
MTRILITGFGPFPSVRKNPSAVLARRLAGSSRLARHGCEVEALELPTLYAAIAGELLPALSRLKPDVVLMLGVAARRKALSVETRALNRVSRLFPDASGRIGRQLAFAPAGPHLQRCRGGAEPLVAVLRRAGLPARRSIDAGKYLCNAAYYAALQKAGRDGPLVVFVHIPMPGTGGRRRGPSLGAMAAGLGRLALVLAGQSRRQRP